MTTETLLTLRSLSRALNLSASWLKDEADAVRIPSLKAGRRRLFNLDAVRQVLLQRAAGASADAPIHVPSERS